MTSLKPWRLGGPKTSFLILPASNRRRMASAKAAFPTLAIFASRSLANRLGALAGPERSFTTRSAKVKRASRSMNTCSAFRSASAFSGEGGPSWLGNSHGTITPTSSEFGRSTLMNLRQVADFAGGELLAFARSTRKYEVRSSSAIPAPSASSLDMKLSMRTARMASLRDPAPRISSTE
jgi:hypothetical protein